MKSHPNSTVEVLGSLNRFFYLGILLFLAQFFQGLTAQSPCPTPTNYTLVWSDHTQFNEDGVTVYPFSATAFAVDGSSIDITVTVPRAGQDDNRVGPSSATTFPGITGVYTPSDDVYRYWKQNDDQIDMMIYNFSDVIALDSFMFGGERPPSSSTFAYAEVTFWDGPDGTGNKIVSALADGGLVSMINTGDAPVSSINVLQDHGSQTSFLTSGTYVGVGYVPSTRPWTLLNMGGVYVRSMTWSLYAADVDVSPAGTNSLDLVVAHANTINSGNLSAYLSSFYFDACDTTCGLGDYVWFDENADGIQNSSEVGIPNVNIYLLDSMGVVVDSTVTNTLGGYSFTELAPGTYSVQFVTPNTFMGFPLMPTDTSATPNDSLDSDANPITGVSQPVTLIEGEFNPTIDAGYFTPILSIGNRVFVDNGEGLNGNEDDGIQQSGEDGVDDVAMSLYFDPNGDGDLSDGILVDRDTTEDGGYYLFDTLGQTNGDTLYIVVVDTSNFEAGGALEEYVSSTLESTDTFDLNDNGVNTLTSLGIQSNPIALTLGNAPVSESDLQPGVGSGSASNENSDLTVDFGFIPPCAVVFEKIDVSGCYFVNGQSFSTVSIELSWLSPPGPSFTSSVAGPRMDSIRVGIDGVDTTFAYLEAPYLNHLQNIQGYNKLSPPQVIAFQLPADGSTFDVFAEFTSETTCRAESMFMLPAPCVPDTCAVGSVGGRIFNDTDIDGILDPGENVDANGLDGVEVRIYTCDPSGNSVLIGTTMSIATGIYYFDADNTDPDIEDGKDYRIEFDLGATALTTTCLGTAGNSTVQFATAPTCDVNLGISNPEATCEENPVVITNCFVRGDPGGANAGDPVLVSFRYNTSGPYLSSNFTMLGDLQTIGSTWGIAVNSVRNVVYSTAFLRRHMAMGPVGLGGIYITDLATNTTTTLVDLDNDGGLGIDFGTIPDNPSRMLSPNGNTLDYDADVFDDVGKVGFGDMDLNGDELFVINLFDKKLYRVDVSSTPITLADVTSYTLPDPGCAGGEMRPWAVKVRLGKVYVGMVCDGSNTEDVGDMRAYIYEFDIATETFDNNPIFDFPLTYPKGFAAWSNPHATGWYPWTDDLSTLTASVSNGIHLQNVHPQPMLADIEFDIDGSIVISLADRTAMMFGFRDGRPDGKPGSESGVAGGDILKGYFNGGVYVLENNGIAGPSVGYGVDNTQGPGFGEFFNDDFFFNNGNWLGHAENVAGGLVIRPGSGEVMVATIDPITNLAGSGGTRTLSTQNGLVVNALEVYKGNATTGMFGKSAGLGDMEIVCPPIEKVEIGNYVWNDANGDGIQDPCENPIAGVNVTIFSVDGDSITTVVTDADGHYFFNNLDSVIFMGDTVPIIVSDSMYTVVFGTGEQYNPANGLLSVNGKNYFLTVSNTGQVPDTDFNDSDLDTSSLIAGGLPHISLTTPLSGNINHTYDAGFTLVMSIGNRVFMDNGEGLNGIEDDGIQQTGEDGVDNVAMSLYFDPNGDGDLSDGILVAQDTTMDGGYYLFDNLSPTNGDTTYIVVVDAMNFGTGAFLDGFVSSTPEFADSLDLNDNGINMPTTFGIQSNPITLTAGNAPTGESDLQPGIGSGSTSDVNSDLTIDFGFLPPCGVVIDNVDVSGCYFVNGQSYSTVSIEVSWLSPPGPPFTPAIAGPRMDSIRVGFIGLDTVYAYLETPYLDRYEDIAGYNKLSPPQVIALQVPADGSTINVFAEFTLDNTCSDNTTVTIPTGCIPDTCATDNIGGTVFNDFNIDGVMDPGEDIEGNGVSGIPVRLYACDVDGNSILVGVDTTNINGIYAFSDTNTDPDVVDGGDYRVEFDLDNSALSTTCLGSTGNSTVQFTTAPTCDVNLGLSNPEETCEENPRVITNCYVKGELTGAKAGDPTIVSFAYDASGSYNPSNFTVLADLQTVGSTWGMALDPVRKKTYTSAFLRRHMAMGPDGLGAIYVSDLATNTTTTLVDLDNNGGLGIDFGTIPTNAERMLSPSGTTPDVDSLVFDKVGKVGIGDMDLNGDDLYLINMFDKRLYEVNISASPITMGAVTSYALPDPGCSNGESRPWALKVKGEKLYVGMLCDGSISQDVGDMRAYVYEFDLGTKVFDPTPVFDFPLTYPKGAPFTSSATNSSFTGWYPWTDDINQFKQFSNTNSGRRLFTHPQPMLVDIEFDVDGSIVISFSDRSGMQLGFDDGLVDGDTSFVETVLSGGDILKGYFNGGEFVLENNAQAGPYSGYGIDNQQGPGFGEFFNDDYRSGSGLLWHSENIVGGLAIRPGSGQVLVAVMDAIDGDPFTGGIRTLNTTNGLVDNAVVLYKGTAEDGFFGKGTGLGDLEIVCLPIEKVEIGNYVWNDINGDGIQDPCEEPLVGVNVTIYSADGDSIATVMTDTSGHYYFNNLDSVIFMGDTVPTILPDSMYTIVFGTGGQYDPVTGWLTVDDEEYAITALNTGQTPGNDINDSDVDTLTGAANGLPHIDLTTPLSGNIDHTFDAGFRQLAGLGDYVWLDTNGDGIQDMGESGVDSVLVYLRDSLGVIIDSTITDTSGYYEFVGLDPGDYSVQFIWPTHVDGFGVLPTLQNQGTLDSLDSDADPLTGITQTVSLASGEFNPTLDAGLIPSSGLGDFVWLDQNGDGIQDVGEPGVDSMLVYLLDSAGVVVDSTITDINGYYEFTNLYPGNYGVQFNWPTQVDGYNVVPTLQNQGTLDSLDSDADPVTGLTQMVTLTPGEFNPTLDAGLIPLCGLGDYVWFDENIDGIQDSTEIGIPEVTVYLLDSLQMIIDSTLTDSVGSYSFTGLLPGTYFVQFAPPDTFMGFTLTPTLHNIGNDSLDSDADPMTGISSAVNLTNGDFNPTIDAGYFPELLSLGSTVFEDLNNNGIQDIGELGISGVILDLIDVGPDGMLGGGDDILVKTDTTDINGDYFFDGLNPGNYVISIGVDNFTGSLMDSPQSSTDIATSIADNQTDNDDNGIQPGGSGTAVNSPVINLSPGQEPLDSIETAQGGIQDNTNDANGDMTIDFGFFATAGLGDYVWLDENGDGIQDSTEVGIPDVTVYLINDMGVIIDSTLTDNMGLYDFTGLVPGTYSVQFIHPDTFMGFTLTPTLQNIGIDSLDSDADPVTGMTQMVTLTSGDFNSTLDAGYTPALLSLGSTVFADLNNNALQDMGEAGIAGVILNLIDVGPDGMLGGGDDVLVKKDTTDLNGDYFFDGLNPGNYVVQIDTLSFAGPLANSPLSSTDIGTSSSDNQTDNDDNGLQTGGPGTLVNSPVINLSPGMEPLDSIETGQGGLQDNSNDANGDMTIDFGFVALAGLGDFVWFDENLDGIQDSTEVGIPGVTVYLMDSLGVIIDSTLTNSTGGYSFIGLIPGPYSVQFVPPDTFMGYSLLPTLHNIGNDSLDSDADPVTGITQMVTLNPGDFISTLDAGFLPIICPEVEITSISGNPNCKDIYVLQVSITPPTGVGGAIFTGTWSTNGKGTLSHTTGSDGDQVTYVPSDKESGEVNILFTIDPEQLDPSCLPLYSHFIINIANVDCGNFPWDGN